MKKILALTLALLMMLGVCATLAACNGGKNPSESTTESTTVNTEPGTTEAPTTKPTEEETTEAPTEPVTTEAPTTETTEAPATETTEAPATETTEAPATETTEAPATETTEAPTTETTEAPATETTEAVAGETTEPVAGETTEAPEVDTEEQDFDLTPEEAAVLGKSLNHNQYTKDKYYVTGTVTRAYANNLVITDGKGNDITVFGAYNEDGTVKYTAMTKKPVVGDTVTVYGVVGQSNGSPRIKDGWIISFEAPLPAPDSEISIENAISIGSSMDHNKYTEGKYYVTGTLTVVRLNNLIIVDENGNELTISNAYNKDGSVKFSAMTEKPAIGDVITVYGVVGQNNGSPRIKDGWVVEFGDPDETETETTKPEVPVTPPTDVIYNNGEEIEDAGIDWSIGTGYFANVKHNVDESSAVIITAAELLERMQDRDGENKLNAGEVYRVKETIRLDECTKYYGNGAAIIAEGGIVIRNAVDVVLKDVIIKGNLTIKNSAEIIFFKVDIQSNDTAVTIDQNSDSINFTNSRIYGDKLAVSSNASGLTLYSCYLRGRGGVELAGDNVTVQNCKVYAVTSAISISGENPIVRENTIRAESSGIGVFVKNSVNGLVALNDIAGIQKSISVEKSFNVAVILNRAIIIDAHNNKNIYIVDNRVGGYVNVTDNNYLICDGTVYPFDGLIHTIINTNNDNKNGNDVTDVNYRPAVGANEEILPHTNKDLFVGMERKSNVTDASLTTEKGLNAYIKEQSQLGDVVIVPPGAYANPGALEFTSVNSGDTIYAYGVYNEFSETDPTKYTNSIIYTNGSSNMKVYGLTSGCVMPSSGQVRVVDKQVDNNGTILNTKDDIYTLTVIPDAGFLKGITYTDPVIFHTWWPETFLYDEEKKEYKYYCEENPQGRHEAVLNEDGTITITLKNWSNTAGQGTYGDYDQNKTAKAVWERITNGTIITCRYATGYKSFATDNSTNVLFRDVVHYGYAGALACVVGTSTNLSYERFNNTTHGANLISKEVYEEYKALEEKWGVDFEVYEEVLEDGTVRYRGPASRSGSIDAFHVTKSYTGVNVTSSLLEGMVDDGSNQHSASSRLHDVIINNDNTVSFIIKGCGTAVTWSRLDHSIPGNWWFSEAGFFAKGNTLFIYTPSGEIVCETPVLEDQKLVQANVRIDIDERDKGGYWHYGHTNYYELKVNRADVNLDALFDENGDPIYNLADNHYSEKQRVTVDNLSSNSCNYTMDNVMVYNGHSRGFLVKSTDIVIKHCTFRNVSYNGLLIRPETEWAESTIARRVLIQQVLFDHVGYIYENYFSKDWANIRIQSTSTVVDEKTLPIDDITITGCKFTNNEQRYAIWVNSAKNIHITNNTFDENILTDRPDVRGTAILLETCMNIEISDNTYNYAHYQGDIRRVIRGSNYANIWGTDVTNPDGSKIFPDNITKK